MRRSLCLTIVAATAAAAVLVTGTALAAGIQRRYRLVRVSGTKGKQQPPLPYTSGPQTCTPDLPGVPDPPTTFEILGPGFDPSKVDEISVARDGKLLAYASSVGETGLPAGTKQIVLLPEGPGDDAIRVTKVGAEDDQPSVQFDEFGYRCAFRSSAGTGGAAPSNIQLHGSRANGATPEIATIAVTALTGTDRAFDPALAARIRVRDVGGGIKVRERDARVAFISTGDLDPGENGGGREQLFLWEELGAGTKARIRQITRNTDDDAHMNRPAISKSGDVIVFESSADLVPDAVDPLDSSRVGNPGHVRQLYRWVNGSGISQITWSDADCFSPRMEINGRFVVFSSRGDPIAGGNPERNSEIFRWVARGAPAARLSQLTQTVLGDSVLPRPTTRPDVFAFFSTAHPPISYPGEEKVYEFGEGPRECTGQALLYSRGRVTHIHGFLDVENAARLAVTPQKIPVLTGPPVPGLDGLKIYFATNDYHLNPKPARPAATPDDSASPFAFHVGMATRYSR